MTLQPWQLLVLVLGAVALLPTHPVALLPTHPAPLFLLLKHNTAWQNTKHNMPACLPAWCPVLRSTPAHTKTVHNGHIKRITDEEIQSSVLEIMSSNVSTTFITCPADPQKTLGIKLPFLVMIVKVRAPDGSCSQKAACCCVCG